MLEFLAAGAPSSAESGLVGFLPIIGIVVIFWFLILRPQMRQQKEHKAKVQAMKKGDQVVTGGGLVGKVVRVDDNYAELELAKGLTVKAVKSTIADIVPPGGAPAND